MAGLDNFLKTYSVGEEFNTKDNHLQAKCNLDALILADIKKYMGLPVSFDNGKLIPFNGDFYGIIVNDAGKYGIGVNTHSVAISKKGDRVVVGDAGLKVGDLVKITGTADTAKFVKASATEVNVAVGRVLCNSFTSFEGKSVVAIDFNTSMIKSTTATEAPATISTTPSK